GAASGLTRALGNPAVYAGPIGWLTGCCPAAAPMEAVVVTQIVKEEGEAVVITVERTATPAKPTAAAATEPTDRPEPTRAPALTQEIPLLTAAPAPTEEAPLPTATPAPTTVPLPTEPYPLRRVFPETLYWDPEAVTGADGTLALDLELADSITTWRLTALASTQDGDVGVATYDIVVFQDFFAELDLPAAITQGETVTVTVTLYNYLDREQTVRLQPEPAEWYTLGSPPLDVTLPPEGIASATFTIRAQEAGNFSLQVGVTGEGMSDAIAREVTVFE
ncbi:MAG: alpha-2-macroglobulin family protein, partial [Anaerolineae bacterium]